MAKELPNITKIAVALSNHSKMLVLDSLMDKRGHTLLNSPRSQHSTSNRQLSLTELH